MRGSRKFCQGVRSNFVNIFFSVDERREDPNTTMRGMPMMAQHLMLFWLLCPPSGSAHGNHDSFRADT